MLDYSVRAAFWPRKMQYRRWYHFEPDCRAWADFFNRIFRCEVWKVIRDGQFWCAVLNYGKEQEE